MVDCKKERSLRLKVVVFMERAYVGVGYIVGLDLFGVLVEFL